MTISELESKKSETIKETRAIVKQAQSENREMTKEEQELFDNNLIEIENLKAQISQLQDKLLEVATETKTEEPKDEPKKEETVEEPKEETPNEDTTEETQEEEEKSEKTENKEEETDNSTEETQEETENEDSEEENKNKTKRNHINMKTFITKEIRSALENGTKKFNLNAETRAIQVTGSNGVHDNVIEETIPGLLEPLYADSIIAKLGVRMYSGMPLSDIRVPAMGKGTAGWVGEVTAAGATNNTFSSVLLQPKRITAYMDISKELIVQDTIGVEDALKRDIYNALVSKVQETFLSADAATTTKPAGIFNSNSITPHNISSYENLVDNESLVDDSNVGGEKKYLMSNKAKAIVRSMAKSALTNELVLTGNNIDGTEVIANSQVPTTMYAFGNFDNIVFAQFGDIEVVVDEYTQAINGCVRLVINAYFDWKKVRSDEDVLVYGTVSRPAANNG